MISPPGVPAPTVRPDMVMVKAAPAGAEATAVVITMESVTKAEVAVIVATEIPAVFAEGAADVLKNEVGKLTVIFPPI